MDKGEKPGHRKKAAERAPDSRRERRLICRLGRTEERAKGAIDRAYAELEERFEERTRELEESRALLTEIADNSPAVIYSKDLEGRLIFINKEYARLFGIPREWMIGKTDYDILPGDIAEEIRANDREVIERGAPAEYEESIISGGERRTYISMKFPLRDAAGTIYGMAGVSTDITERKRAEEALRESKERFRTLADNIAQLAWMADASGWIFWYNKRWFDYTGTTLEEMQGWGWRKVHHPDHVQRVVEKIGRCFRTGEVWEDTFPLRGKDGQYRWFLSRAIPIRDEQDRILRWFGTNTDITDRMLMEEEIRHMAHHDALTGLPNRRLFLDIVTIETAQARRHAKKLAILFLDLDRFKEVNDTLGHEAGDRLLKEVAERLRESVRESDTVARIGGDEFNILLADIVHTEDIALIARKVVDAFRKPYTVNGHELSITTSIGISVYPDDAEEIEPLFRYADIALYHAKERGRNAYQFFSDELNSRTVERVRIESDLRRTLERGELTVHYQPQIDIASRTVVCAEALVRWQHPEEGLLGPVRFLPVAEETGLVSAIDEWVLRTACAQVRGWQEEGWSGLFITVNLSGRQLHHPELGTLITGILEETGLTPECLDIEVAERVVMSNIERASTRLNELARKGLRISIDDFGTGCSSVIHLKRLPVQRLKIDRSFIHDIATDPDDRAIITAVTSLAHSMQMRVVAEGVETEEQLSFLRASRCDEMQGNLFSAPLPAGEFGELMRRGA